MSFISLHALDYSKQTPKKRLSPQVQAHYEQILQKHKANPFHQKDLKSLMYDKANLKDLPETAELPEILQTIDKRIEAKKAIEALSTLLRRSIDTTDVLTNVIALSENSHYLDEEDKKTVEKIGEARNFKEKYTNPSWKHNLIKEEEQNNKRLSKGFEKYKVDYKNKLEPFKQACENLNKILNFPVPSSSPIN